MKPKKVTFQVNSDAEKYLSANMRIMRKEKKRFQVTMFQQITVTAYPPVFEKSSTKTKQKLVLTKNYL